MTSLVRQHCFVPPETNGREDSLQVLELSSPGAFMVVNFNHVFPERRSLVEDGHPQVLDQGPEVIKRVLNRGTRQTPSYLRRDAADGVELLA